MSIELRKRTYSAFAKQANDAGVRWIVLHGIEGYPKMIGRDLDIRAMDTAHTTRLLDIFEAVLSREKYRWIVHTSPTWGRRILGITEDYAVVELHTFERVRVANVNFQPDWNAVEYIQRLFPVERFITFCKACMMPAIAGDKSWRAKCDSMPQPDRVPWWLGRAADQVRAREDVTVSSKLFLCGGFLLTHPLASAANAFWWLRAKIMAHFEPTAPVYALPQWIEPAKFERLVKERLGELFLDTVCGDELSWRKIRVRQSRQQLVYVTRARGKNVVAIGSRPLNVNDLLKFIVTSFVEFNERWRP